MLYWVVLKILLAGKYRWAKWMMYYLFLLAMYVWRKDGSNSMMAQFHFHYAGVFIYFFLFNFLFLVFWLVTGLHNLPCRSVLGLLSLLEDVLIQIGRKLGQKHGWPWQRILEEDIKYKDVVSWIKQRHKSMCRSSSRQNSYQGFDSYTYPL